MTSHIVVVGGGVAGLAAALRLREHAPSGTRITVYEQSTVPGGKVRTGEVAGVRVEVGAEAFLTRDPTGGDSAAVELARRVGLADALVHPTTTQAALAVDGALHPMPPGTFYGVPGDLEVLPPVAHANAGLDLDAGRPLLGPDEDVSVGALVRARLGDEVADRLVDPMLGGVYAGRADDLSLAVTIPALARACRVAHTLTGAVRMLTGAGAGAGAGRGPSRAPVGPMFATVDGGMGRFVDALAAAVVATGMPAAEGAGTPALDGAGTPAVDRSGLPGTAGRVELGLPVRELHRDGRGWRLVVGPTNRPRQVEADAVVLALPARPAARLLDGVHPEAAQAIGALDYASMALVTLLLPEPALPDLSGLLVPATEGTAVKAATFFTTKWGHLRRTDGMALVRASLGRYGEEWLLQREDDDLVKTAHTELSRLIGRSLPEPSGAHVQRWGGALPQYRPGHAGRVAAARAVLADAHPTLALAGAGYDGVGVPMCIRSGQTAADHLVKAMGDRCD